MAACRAGLVWISRCGCLAVPALAVGLASAAREGAARAPSLAAGGNPLQGPLHSLVRQGRMRQKQSFQVGQHGAQVVLEVRRQHRPAEPVRRGPQVCLATVGAQPSQGDQGAIGAQFLLDRAIAPAMELLHPQQPLRDLIQRPDAPAAVVQAGEVLRAVAPAIQQCRGQGTAGWPLM